MILPFLGLIIIAEALVINDGCANCAIDPKTKSRTPLTISESGLESSSTPSWPSKEARFNEWSMEHNTTIIAVRYDPLLIRSNFPVMMKMRAMDLAIWTSTTVFGDTPYDLTSIAEELSWNTRFPQRLLDVHSSPSGGIRGLPNYYGFWGIWYKKETFSNLNQTIPVTWEQFLNVCVIIKASGMIPITLGLADQFQPETWWEYLSLRIGGNTWWDAFQRGEKSMDDPVIVKVWREMDRLKEFFPPVPDRLLSLFSVLSQWVKQERAMILMSSVTHAFLNQTGNNPSGYDWFPFPELSPLIDQEKGEFSTQSVWVVNKWAKQLPMALEWIKWKSQDSIALSEQLPGATGYAPPQLSLREKVIFSPSLLRGFKMLDEIPRVHVFIDNTIEPWSSRTRPLTVNWVIGGMTTSSLLSSFETAKQEILLSRVSSPVITGDRTITITTTTANSTIYYQVSLVSSSLLDSGSIKYLSPFILSAGEKYRVRAFARRDFMKDSDIVERIIDTTGEITVYAQGMGMQITIIVLSQILIVAGMISSTMIHRWREKKLIRASSPLFLQVIIVGCILIFITVGLLAIDSITVGSCTAVLLTSHLGYVIALGGISAKTWRIIKIFNTDNLRGEKITDTTLVKYLGYIIGILSVYLLVWISVDGPRPISFIDYGNNIWYTTCASSSNLWQLTLLFVEAIGLLMTCILAYRVRNNPTAFNESFWIALSVYNIAVVGGIILLIVLSGLVWTQSGTTILNAVGLSLATIGTLSLILIPKVVLVRRYGESIDLFSSGITKVVSGEGKTGEIIQSTDRTLRYGVHSPLPPGKGSTMVIVSSVSKMPV